MSRFNKYSVALVISAFALLFACDKEDSSEIYPPNAISTCSDGVQNQGEFKIDCGGPCDSCILNPEMTAFIDSFWIPDTMRGAGFWGATHITGRIVPSGLNIFGIDSNTLNIIQFTHNQDFAVGVYSYQDIEGSSFGCDFTDGIVEFSSFDTIQRTVTGTFSFNCIGYTLGKKERVLNGKFVDIKYN